LTKREVFQLLKLISVYYDSFEFDQEKVDQWFVVLEEECYRKLEANLWKHVTCSPYPPRVSELVCKPVNGSRAIPNGDDTKYIIYTKDKPASKEVVEKSLAQIRGILGIKRGED
jgi:hypothetical protein